MGLIFIGLRINRAMNISSSRNGHNLQGDPFHPSVDGRSTQRVPDGEPLFKSPGCFISVLPLEDL